MATRKVTPLVRTRGVKVCEFIEKFCLAPEGDLIGKPNVTRVLRLPPKSLGRMMRPKSVIYGYVS